METTDNSRSQRQRFGVYLRALRERTGMTQIEAGGKLVDRLGGTEASWQSLLARYEQGKGAVKPEQLRQFASVYNEPLERMLSAYAAAHVFDGALPKYLDEPSQKRPDIELSQNFFVSNAVEIWSLPEIAQWEADLADRTSGSPPELWIVSPEFIDHRDNSFLHIVVDQLLLRQASLTYFVAKRDIGGGEKFDVFLDRVTSRLARVVRERGQRLADTNIGSISVFGLTPDDLTWFTSSLVIANPNDIEAGVPGVHAFMIVPVAGQHTLGIPVEPAQLVTMVNLIARQIENRQADPDNRDKPFIVNALRKHPPFVRELEK
ncbi:MAG TPA: helix-turn-helix transcriptional regulator [Allosphingosinicella sp.]|jgi:transcriptional regulator with XRE-family HTH domain|uniref:helix-turn-helix domain-containing protein n=1 Tax=Allosphingosinicella sp. TaxID=2823234 RepID=UPI002F28C522